MALSMTVSRDIEFVGLVQLPVYCKVTQIHGSKDAMVASVSMMHMASGGPVVDCRSVAFVLDLDGPNFIAQAYAHAKSLPEFAGATDC
jgi:hypothetical protein